MGSNEQHLGELAAIQPPSDANDGSDFADLRQNVIQRHIAAAMTQADSHRAAAREIRQRMDLAQTVFDFYSGRKPSTPADTDLTNRDVAKASDRKRAYSQMLMS